MLANYLKIAVRVLLRRKFYTGVSLFGIAFTLLVLVLCTALLDELFAPAAPETRLGRLLSMEVAVMSGPQSQATSSPGYALLDRYARGLPGVELLSVVTRLSTVASFVDGNKVESQMRRTDGVFWDVMDFDFLEGGPYTEADERQGNFVAVINETTRRRIFGGRPALGRNLRADGQDFTVIGVVPDVAPTRHFAFAELWAPNSTAKSRSHLDDLVGDFVGILLARDRAQFPQIKAELKRRLDEAQITEPGYDRLESAANTRFEDMAHDILGTSNTDTPVVRLRLILGAVALLFMILPALNLVNMNLSRILERSSEIGVRKAFGASSVTLVGQFLVESVLLTLIGGALGLLGSWVALGVINHSDLIPYADVQLNYRVFGYGLLLSVVFGLLSGAYPAWRMSRMHPVQALYGRNG